MHIGATKMRFGRVRERIWSGVKRVGGLAARAVPGAWLEGFMDPILEGVGWVGWFGSVSEGEEGWFIYS